MDDKIMEILKGDSKSRKMMEIFHNTATEQGLKGSEYMEARKTMLMLIIANNPEALETMGREVYDQINR